MNKENKLIKIIITTLRKIFMNRNKVSIIGNDEYKMDIGTLYKGSNKESNRLLRFKERFKMKYIFAYGYAQGNKGGRI